MAARVELGTRNGREGRAGEQVSAGQVRGERGRPPSHRGSRQRGAGASGRHGASAPTVATVKKTMTELQKPPCTAFPFSDFLLLKAATKIHLIGVLKPFKKL